MKNLKVWDYKLPRNWRPKNDFEWQWYLVRKINYGDFSKSDLVKNFYWTGETALSFLFNT